SISIANATFSYNPAMAERPGNFSITVEGRVYQLQAEDYHTKMYWLQELQERRKCFSQLRTSLARDSTKRSSVEPSTGLVSTKKMKEKGGDPWAGLPPLLQPVTTPIHSVGEEAAVSTKGGISFNSLKNPIEGIRRWKSLHQDTIPTSHTQVQTADPGNQPSQPAPPIPKPRRKHQVNTEGLSKRPTSILQRFSSSASEHASERCPKCKEMLSQIISLKEELELVDSEAKASQEVTQYYTSS
ncbi:putative TBC1 domain family member 2B, partial [Apostichopus japonicus]